MIAALLIAGLGSQAACIPPKRQAKAQARVDLGSAFLVEGSTEMAIQQLQEAVELDRRNHRAWEQLGLAYMKRGVPDKSEYAFKRALKLVPESASVNLNYSYLLLRLGRSAEAVEVLEVAMGDLTYRMPAMVLNNLGYALFLEGRHVEAEQRLREATLRAPNFCQAWFNIGLAQEAQGNRREAVRSFEKVVLLCPEEAAGSYLKAGGLMIGLDSPAEGCHYLQAASDLAHGTPLGDEASDAFASSCAG